MSTTVDMILRGRLTAEFIAFLRKGRIANFIHDAPDVVKGKQGGNCGIELFPRLVYFIYLKTL
jgi:hypothetical protein